MLTEFPKEVQEYFTVITAFEFHERSADRLLKTYGEGILGFSYRKHGKPECGDALKDHQDQQYFSSAIRTIQDTKTPFRLLMDILYQILPKRELFTTLQHFLCIISVSNYFLLT